MTKAVTPQSAYHFGGRVLAVISPPRQCSKPSMEEETTVKEMEGDGVEETLAEGAPREAGHGGGTASEGDKNPISSSDDSDSDDETGDEFQIQALEKALAENPMNYEAHVQYIHALRKHGLIEKLREARESMNKHFPLSPKMWQEWTKDEASFSTNPEGFAEIEKLYERGVHEYLSVSLWCDYLDFVQEHDHLVCQCTPVGLSKMRNLFERALTAAGLHMVEGNKIWEAYREFEQAILLTISDDNNEEKAKQVQRIRALFHRELSVPFVDLRSALMAYKHWEIEQGNPNDINSELDGVPHHIASAYQKALELYKARSVYEDQLSSCGASNDDRLEKFMNYIKYEESMNDPARVQILYERAVSEFPISSDLWLGYSSYLDRTLKVPSVLKSVYSRATRNCTWVGDLWVRYLLSLERMHASEKELSDVFEQSMRCVFPSFNEYLDLFLTRVDGLRRRISVVGAKEDGLDYALIRETFQRAVDYLSPQQVSTNDLLRLHTYWAHLEANLGKDLVAARGVWESLIRKSGSILEVWQSYVAMEIEMGNINEARSIYKRCYSKRFLGTGSEDICYSWLRFEREHGTLDDLDLAVKKVTPRLKELVMFKTQQESKSGIPFSAVKENSSATITPQKRKVSKMSNEKQPTAKRQRGAGVKSVDSSDIDQTKESGRINDAGFVNKVTLTTLPEAVNTGASNKQQIGDSESRESKTTFYTDHCTAFVSNLSFEAKDEHLREFFADCGGVIDIRILKDKYSGRSRGLAYVDFSGDEHLAAAIAKNKQKLLGKKLSIARSNPKQSQKRAYGNSSSSREHGRGIGFRNDHSGRAAVSKTVVENSSTDVKLVGKNTFATPRAVVRPLEQGRKKRLMDK